jgi:hypothetical protein
MDEYERINELKKLLESKDRLLRVKDDQVQTLENSIKLKDEQVKTLESSIRIKDEKSSTLEKTIELKEEEIRKLSSTSIDRNTLKEKDDEILQLQKEIEILNEELAKADEDLERLELENERLRKEDSSTHKIIDFTNIKITNKEILEKMRRILPNAMSNVTIVVPSIEELQDLYLYEVRASVSVNICCSISHDHTDLIQEFESLDNITIKNYELKDRYGIVRDAEELLIAVVGNSNTNHLTFHTKDPKHIRLLNSLITEAWIRSRKV